MSNGRPTGASKVVEVKTGESVCITLPPTVDNTEIRLTLERKSGHRARLRFTAGRSIVIEREEPEPTKA